MLGFDFAGQRLENDKTHHNLGTAGQDPCPFGLQSQAIEQYRHDANLTTPVLLANVHRDFHFDSRLAPGVKLVDIQQIVRGSCAIQQEHASEVVAMVDDVVNRRTQRCQTDAAASNHDIATVASCYGPCRAKGTAQRNLIASFLPRKCSGHIAGHTNRMRQLLRLQRVRADRNGRFPKTRQVEHIELPRQKAIAGRKFRVLQI